MHHSHVSQKHTVNNSLLINVALSASALLVNFVGLHLETVIDQSRIKHAASHYSYCRKAQSNSFSHSLTVGSFAGDVDDQSLY